LVLYSFAKLNLYLKVLNKRKDGFHNLSTVFEKISLCDKIILKSRRDSLIKITCQDADVPLGRANLCYKSASLLRRRFQIKQGLDIKIIKRIPVGAGLGGGSANAASVLLGLNRLWQLNLSRKKLAEIAGEIGSDAAFFIYDSSFAQASGRGERIMPLKKAEKLKIWHVLVVPKLKVSTPFIFQKWDELSRKGELTTVVSSAKLTTLALTKKGFPSLGKALFNSLQEVTIKCYPEVGEVIKALSGLGAQAILMSGSGPAVFALCASRKEAVSLKGKLKKKNRSWRVFLTATGHMRPKLTER